MYHSNGGVWNFPNTLFWILHPRLKTKSSLDVESFIFSKFGNNEITVTGLKTGETQLHSFIPLRL